MKIAQHPDNPHLSLEIDGISRTSIEHCSRCGKSQSFDAVQTMMNALRAGSAFGFQHSLPNCGKNGLKDLIQPCTEQTK